MGLFELPQVTKIIGIVDRVTTVAEKLIGNTDIMEQFKETGLLKAGFSCYDYQVYFTVEDRRKTAKTAEVIEIGTEE